MAYLRLNFRWFYNRSHQGMLMIAIFALMGMSQAWAQSAFEDPGSREGSSQGSDLSTVESKIDAGAIALNSESQVVVLLRNDGSKPIAAGEISLYPSSNISASVGENECAQVPLSSGAVCAIAIAIKGLQVGKFRTEILIRHDGRAKLLTTTVSGSIERSDDAGSEAVSDIESVPSALDFGTLKDSRSMTRSIVMRNITSKELTIDSMEIESHDQAGYSLKSDCKKLVSGEACLATVTWAPQQRGPATGVLVAHHDGPTGVISVILDGDYTPDAAEEVSIFPEAVPGKGLLTASQTEVDFGTGIGSASSITVSLVNVGDSPLTFNDINLSNNDNGIKVEKSGCKAGVVLNPVEACPLTLTWEPVRAGSILDDIQISHDGARGILVLPVRGEAEKVFNKDTKTIVLNKNDDDFLSSIPRLSARDVEGQPSTLKSEINNHSVGSLDGFKVTSLAKDRAVVSGPGGSRVVFNNQETVIGGVLWHILVSQNAVQFASGDQKVLLLFDHSLSLSTGGRAAMANAVSNVMSAGTGDQ